MKVEHILVSLLFVFLLYHFTCKCRVEGFEAPAETPAPPPEWVDVSAGAEPWEAKGKWGCQGGGQVDWPTQANNVPSWPYCVYNVGETVTTNGYCRLEYRQDGDRYNEIVCNDGRPLGKFPDKDYPPKVFDRIEWGKCGGKRNSAVDQLDGHFYTWEKDGKHTFKCKKCTRGGTQSNANEPYRCSGGDTNMISPR